MRIVVSGTHGTGKSTLISDVVRRHPEFIVLPDPFELLDEMNDAPTARMFAAQLRLSAERLIADDGEQSVIAERGPLDFLAYLLALAELGMTAVDDTMLERTVSLTAETLTTIDLLVVLPLTDSNPIRLGSDEHLELRDVMNDVLLELIDDPDVVPTGLAVAELVGTPTQRLAALEALLPD